MKSMRTLALPAVAAAAVLTMTGCFQLPGAPTTPASTTSSDGGSGGSESNVDLADTSWSGTDSIGNEFSFTLNSDNTVDFSDFNGETYDEPGDTWNSDGSSVEIVITGVPTSAEAGSGTTITYSGAAATGSMSLTGSGEDGESYTIDITQG